ADLWSRGRPQFDTVKAEATKCPLGRKELHDLAIAAWHEALGLPVPSAAELQEHQEQAAASDAALREAMIAELKGGPAGIRKWDARSERGRKKAGKLRKAAFPAAKLADAELAGIDFQGAVFEGAAMRQVRLGGCQLQQANFAKADLTGAWLNGAK